MKVMKTLTAICIATASFAPQAEVGLSFNDNLTPLVVDNEASGLWAFAKPKFKLPDGTNQVVFRVSKLVDNNFGEKEKFNSEAFVVTFDAADVQLTLAPDTQITRLLHVEQFNKNPKMKLTDENGNNIDFTIEELPYILGLGRDYEKELREYNVAKGIVPASAPSEVAIPSNVQVVQVGQLSGGDASQMVSYWSKKATPQEREQFTNWVFENRQSQQLSELEGSKALEMMSYWYIEATAVERKSILAWLVSQ
ncbi:DUF2057 domain-containing protein [Vibrio rhodolitus]|uniref:YccT family protein n=1 Tax=Vibrio rhodolitus TaxID=2231649 RepID=UPI000E0A3FB5|nr:DUF2057 domain-containing protein [Vibrio rhodolitus]